MTMNAIGMDKWVGVNLGIHFGHAQTKASLFSDPTFFPLRSRSSNLDFTSFSNALALLQQCRVSSEAELGDIGPMLD